MRQIIAGQARYLCSRYLYYGIYQPLRQPLRVAHRRQLLQNCTLDPDEIAALQRQKLSALLHHAYEHVPYYRRVFDERQLHPRDIREPSDLEQLPLLTKSLIQENAGELRAQYVPPRFGRIRRERTGGSTGQPITLYVDDESWSMGVATVDRFHELCGWKPGNSIATLLTRRLRPQLNRPIRDNLIDWAINRTQFHTYGISEIDAIDYLRHLGTLRPKMLFGYRSALVLLAQLAREHGHNVRPGMIVSTGEVLMPADRQVLESTFQCAVFDRYGATEAALLTTECPTYHQRHINTDVHVVEFLRDGRPVSPETPGMIVVTNLHSFAMPLIRYVLGDVGTPSGEPCECELPFPIMRSMEGRALDFIKAPSGRLFHASVFHSVLDWRRGIRQWQAVQVTADELVIQLVPAPDFDPKIVAAIESMITRHLDAGFRVDVRVVDQIEIGLSGKFRTTMSRVPGTFA